VSSSLTRSCCGRAASAAPKQDTVRLARRTARRCADASAGRASQGHLCATPAGLTTRCT
jgi:hypothetical protein